MDIYCMYMHRMRARMLFSLLYLCSFIFSYDLEIHGETSTRLCRLFPITLVAALILTLVTCV